MVYDSLHIYSYYPSEINTFVWDYVLYGNPFVIIKRHLNSPRLTYPPNNSLGLDSSFYFSWGNIVNAINYKVEIAKDSEFTDIVFTDLVNEEELQSPQLTRGIKHFWRVKALGPSDQSEWSSIWNFTIDTTIAVELISFKATANGSCIILNWQTATETNNNGFEVERKAPLNLPKGETYGEWENVGFVKGMGNTTESKSYSFADINVSSGKYKYRLKQIDLDGSFDYSKIVEVEVGTPNEFSLSQNYPNPFNPVTKINYSIPRTSFVTLKVYDILGNKVTTLINEEKQTGNYQVEFNASNLPDSKAGLTSGVYFYTMQAGDFYDTRKFILMR
jgi:hypothetical protein